MVTVSQTTLIYGPTRQKCDSFTRGVWVFHKKSGRVGLVDKVFGHGKYMVQFGSGGPFQVVYIRDLLLASQAEVNEKEGVTC